MTKDQMKQIQTAAYSLFTMLAGDALAMEQEMGNSYISRDVAIELVCDADRLTDQLRRDGKTELAAEWDKLDWKGKTAAVRPAFKHARYS